MIASLSAFDALRAAIQRAAAIKLERKHPECVASFRHVLDQTGDTAKALDAVKGIPMSGEFVAFERLLTATLDTELAMDKLISALNLFKTVPPRELLDEWSMSEGALIDYNYSAWVFWMDALLERVKKLVSQAVRTLVRPHNPRFKDIERALLNSVDRLSSITGHVRNPLAHGGGAVQALEEERLWVTYALLGAHTDISELYHPLVEYRDTWHQRLRHASTLALAEIERVSSELNRRVDWDAL